MRDGGYQTVEQLLWFQNILNTDLEDFKVKPSKERMQNLVNHCQQYLDAVNSGSLKLPTYLTSNR